MTSKCLARAHGGLKCCSQINIVERARLGESVFGTSMGTPVEDAFDFIQRSWPGLNWFIIIYQQLDSNSIHEFN